MQGTVCYCQFHQFHSAQCGINCFGSVLTLTVFICAKVYLDAFIHLKIRMKKA